MEAELIADVLKGDAASFEPLVQKYSPRVFATARFCARLAERDRSRTSLPGSLAQSIRQTHKVFVALPHSNTGWMRMTVRTCYDFLRGHQRNRESSFSDLRRSGERLARPFRHAAPETLTATMPTRQNATHRTRVGKVIAARPGWSSVLLEIRDRSVKEIATLTGWSHGGAGESPRVPGPG